MTSKTIAFGSGALFAIGLGVSGMTLPTKVIGFLDFTGNWDPSLAFVMVGAIAVYMTIFRYVRHHDGPVMGESFGVPTNTTIDRRLILGAAIFGAGWGLGGLCPGPAFTTLSAALPGVIAFTVAMTIGSMAPGLFDNLKMRRAA